MSALGRWAACTALVALSGCGPDRLLGDYFVESSRQDTTGGERTRSQWMSIVPGDFNDYAITLFDEEEDPCELTADRAGDDVASVTPRQRCTYTSGVFSILGGELTGGSKYDTVLLELSAVRGEVGYRFVYRGTRRPTEAKE